MVGKSSKVNELIAIPAIEKAKDRGSVYSQCVILSFRSMGKLDCGFNNSDLQVWIKENRPGLFDEKGNKTHG